MMFNLNLWNTFAFIVKSENVEKLLPIIKHASETFTFFGQFKQVGNSWRGCTYFPGEQSERREIPVNPVSRADIIELSSII